MSKLNNLPQTDFSVFSKLIIECLITSGGNASRQKVLGFIDNKLSGHFLPGDLVWRNAPAKKPGATTPPGCANAW